MSSMNRGRSIGLALLMARFPIMSKRARSDFSSNGTKRVVMSGTTSSPSRARVSPLMRIGTPFIRRVQKRFGRESAAAMRRIVQEA